MRFVGSSRERFAREAHGANARLALVILVCCLTVGRAVWSYSMYICDSSRSAVAPGGAGTSSGRKRVTWGTLGRDGLPIDDGGSTRTEPAGLHSLVDSPTAYAWAYTLDRKLIDSVADDNNIVVTWANYHYLDFVLTWVGSLKDTGCTSFLVGAMDDKILQELIRRSIPTFAMQSNLTEGEFGWGTNAFHKMGREKMKLIQVLADLNVNAWISDVDTVYLRNPIPVGKTYPRADVLVSTDHLGPSSSGLLDRWPEGGTDANIGLMLVRPTAKKLLEAWVPALEIEPWDQSAFNYLLRKGLELEGEDPPLYRAFDCSILVGFLSTSAFGNGHTFFVQRSAERPDSVPHALHATFQYSGTAGKRHRMREWDLWRDDPAYFSHPKGFLAAPRHVPSRLLDAARQVPRNGSLASTLPHFELVHYQLRQLRSQRALARALGGKGVVLPELWCGLDRYWGPHTGTFRGAVMQLPYRCPADHVLDIEKWHEKDPHGFREHSFLARRGAEAVAQHTLVVQLCSREEEAACYDGSTPMAVEGNALRVLPGRTVEQMRVVLSAAQDKFQVISFEADLNDMVVPSPAELEDMKTMELYTSIWCCVEAHPGHVWYDPLADLVPHTDRFGRQFNESWTPLTGP